MNEQKNHRLSRQRQVILQELRKVDTHPTADEVYDMVRKIMPRISLGTVYRNLELLCSQGQALKLGPAGGQKRFDGNAEPHPHLRCARCTRVMDIMCPVEIPELPGEYARGFMITGASVEYVGLCAECRVLGN